MSEQTPSIDKWLEEAKQDKTADKVGMYLIHNGVVRKSPRAEVRDGVVDGSEVSGMTFDYDEGKVAAAIAEAKKLPGIFYIRVWCNRGELELGESIMVVLIGADIRPHAVEALTQLVGEIKTNCVVEKEHVD